MADILSVAASIIAVTTVALQSVHVLSATIDNIKDAPNDVTSIRADLKAVEAVLRQLDISLQGGTLQIALSDQIKPALENCFRVCATFQKLLDQWMKHSREDKTFWMDRWRVGLFGQDRIKTFKGRLNDCKGTLSVALSTANVIITSRELHIMKEMKDMMLEQNERVLQQEITLVDSQGLGIESSTAQLLANGSTQLSEESEQSRQELLEEIQQQQASSNALKKMCEEAYSRTVYERTRQNIKGIKGTNQSLILAGFVNTLGEESKINQDISDVTADGWSVVAAGVIKNIDFKDLRPSSPPDSMGRGK
ncbi:hypothetical protein B0O99DRAFT_597076 [Bisporella sp. PMI_857]|nr:hypothetical protein B0O99DRAFT_597076 [Bisporella sp. PMI_857]